MRWVVVAIICILCSCKPPTNNLVSQTQFTDSYAVELRRSATNLTVDIVNPLELRTVDAQKQEHQVFLDNAYKEYGLDPDNKAGIISKHIASLLETLIQKENKIVRTQIVPVIKDKAWANEIQASLEARGAKGVKLSQVFEPYNTDLIIVYAEDSGKNIRYFSDNDLKDLGIKREELRSVAVENLRRILPQIELRGGPDVFMMTAGGDYEASLLLLDSIWQSDQIKVNGETVVAIPARDTLLITGSKNKEGIRIVRATATKLATDAPYRLTTTLFVYRNGAFVEFKEWYLQQT